MPVIKLRNRGKKAFLDKQLLQIVMWIIVIYLIEAQGFAIRFMFVGLKLSPKNSETVLKEIFLLMLMFVYNFQTYRNAFFFFVKKK